MTISIDFCPAINEDAAFFLAQHIALQYIFGFSGKVLDAIAQTGRKRRQYFCGDYEVRGDGRLTNCE